MAALAGYAYENFIETIAQLVSRALTDKETEAIIQGFKAFQEKLRRLSSENIRRLAFEQPERPSSCKHEGKTCTQNVTRGFAKAFMVFYIVKYLIAVAPSLLTGQVFKKPTILRLMAGRDTFSFALFLSTFISSYKAILCTLRNLRQCSDPASDKLNALVAGSVAGLSLVIEKNRGRRLAIMLYLVTRSSQFGCAWLMKKWAEKRRHRRREIANEMREQLESNGFQDGESRRLVIKKGWDDKLAKFLVQWAGTGVMMLASAQIIYAFLFEGDTLPKSYFGFLLDHSGWKPYFGSLAAPLAFSIRETVNKLARAGESIRIPKGVSSRDYIARHVSPNIATIIPPNLRHEFVLCALQHPLHDSCTRSKIILFCREFVRALKLYVPLNGIMTATFRWNQITTQPEKVLLRFVQSTFQSTLFLTSYVVWGMATPCIVRPVVNREGQWIYALAGVLAGSMVMIEAPGRRLELGLYCLPRALESFWRCMIKWGYVCNVPHGDVLLFSSAMGVLMMLYQNEPDTINPHYLSVMTRFFGRN